MDYYDILQVNPRAEKEVIDAAYRKLAAKYHPDVSQESDAAERMKRINTAYEVLSNPAKRAAYDASRGMAPAPDTPHQASPGLQRYTKAWRILLITTVLILLAVVLFRSGPALLLLVPRLLVPLVVIALVVWLIFTLAKPKR